MAGRVLKLLAVVGVAPQKFLPISSEMDGFDWQFIYYSSLYRSDHEGFLRSLILNKGGDCFFDIGANVGGWALRATKYFRDVYAFEPHPRTAAILRRNVEKNRSRIDPVRRLRVYQCALGNQNGRTKFYSDRMGDRGNGGASLTLLNPEHPYPARHSVRVEVRRFDDLRLPCSPMSLVKIDTEGGEVAVLEGMKRSLSEQHPRLAVEAHGQENIRQCKRILGDFDYKTLEIPLSSQSYFLAE